MLFVSIYDRMMIGGLKDTIGVRVKTGRNHLCLDFKDQHLVRSTLGIIKRFLVPYIP